MIQENQFRMLQDEYLHRIQKTDTSNKRYLYHQINWDARLICIRGARGTGKTTIIKAIAMVAISNMGSISFNCAHISLK